jgi:hypothetical protein
MYRVRLLLTNDQETNNKVTFAARQQILNKQLYAAVNWVTTSQTNTWPTRLEYNNKGVFYAVRADMLQPRQI